MQGQFGSGKSESGGSNATSSTTSPEATSAVSLSVSSAPLDSDLRKSIDNLPRRVNDQFSNLGDMVNFVIVGTKKMYRTRLRPPHGTSPTRTTKELC
jgi:hypothetical protein